MTREIMRHLSMISGLFLFLVAAICLKSVADAIVVPAVFVVPDNPAAVRGRRLGVLQKGEQPLCVAFASGPTTVMTLRSCLATHSPDELLFVLQGVSYEVQTVFRTENPQTVELNLRTALPDWFSLGEFVPERPVALLVGNGDTQVWDPTSEPFCDQCHSTTGLPVLQGGLVVAVVVEDAGQEGARMEPLMPGAVSMLR